ncbi:MAG TPA: 30S ribosomal protein S8 [Ktedonobacteraceae bacterium]|jgi:small subunit ribosomal protein S8|nr:30S ribosomal protein S8 [Ktedonobacteraceae bacterium]
MNMTDPIADMLTRIRNAATARHTRVLVPASKMKLSLARVLKEEGYIKDIEILKDNPQGTLRLTLRYVDKKPVLTQLKRVSKPGLRVYTKKADIPRVRGGLGIAVLSTPRGLMTGSSAYKQGLGGEVICYIW